MKKLLSGCSLAVILFTAIGCEHHRQQENKLMHEPMFLTSGKTSDMKTTDVDGRKLHSLVFTVTHPNITKYAQQPSPHARDVHLRDLTDHFRMKRENVFAIFTKKNSTEFAVAKVDGVEHLTPSKFALRYTPDCKKGKMFSSIKDNEHYSLRLVTLPRGEDDVTLLGKNGAEITPLSGKRFQIVLKGFEGVYVIDNSGKKFSTHFTTEAAKIQKAFKYVNEHSHHLNSDIYVSDKEGKYASFQVESIDFNPREKTMTMTVLPLKTRSSICFFRSVNAGKHLFGTIKLHIDGRWMPI